MKNYQNIILYTESAENSWNTPSKIANTFLNRFVIDEDLACEIIGTYNLSNNDVDNFGIIHNSLEKAAAYKGHSKNIHFVFARNYLSLGKTIENMIADWTRRSRRSVKKICHNHALNNEKTYFGYERTNDGDNSGPGMKNTCAR